METYTRSELMSSRDGIWAVCEGVFTAFEKCKLEKGNDPEKCLRQSTVVVACSQKVMREIINHCGDQLKTASTSLEENNMRTLNVEKEKKELDDCFNKLVLPKFQ